MQVRRGRGLGCGVRKDAIAQLLEAAEAPGLITCPKSGGQYVASGDVNSGEPPAIPETFQPQQAAPSMAEALRDSQGLAGCSALRAASRQPPPGLLSPPWSPALPLAQSPPRETFIGLGQAESWP